MKVQNLQLSQIKPSTRIGDMEYSDKLFKVSRDVYEVAGNIYGRYVNIEGHKINAKYVFAF